MYLVLGDWSDDGHGKTNKVLLLANKTVKEIQDAYKASCKLTGMSFNHNEDYTGLNRDYSTAKKYTIVTEYDDSFINNTCKEICLRFGFNEEQFDTENKLMARFDWHLHAANFVPFWTWFVKLSLPDLEIDVSSRPDDYPCINGYWSKELNVQFGYGIYN